VTSWPGTNAVGAGFRGGDWGGNVAIARLSSRVSAASTGSTRNSDDGGRGVRLAP
jgi:hypothetical protein